MRALRVDDFSAFFEAVHGYSPFTWQQRLLERIQKKGRWPDVIDLPTASGKTACLDIAIFSLALQFDRPLAQRTAPRRVWFVVDRRIIVDEACDRAKRLALALRRSRQPVVREVARRLRHVSGTHTPLAVGRLRGGVWEERRGEHDGWARLPSQPAVITSTVDQMGSRMLFRAYGARQERAPIDAGLVCFDSLVILDEAHCAEPFRQTVELVQRYAGRPWTLTAIAPTLQLTCMSATQRPGSVAAEIFPRPGERKPTLADRDLQKRLQTPKPVGLEVIAARRGEQTEDKADLERAALMDAAAARALEYAGRHLRAAVMVNRVATAALIARRLKALLRADQEGEANPRIDVLLLTGRMRPLDRDVLLDQWSGFLRAWKPDTPSRPIIVVTTQCLEIGADFSFGALVTECASFDALRQRFGRLARLGEPPTPEATILITASLAKDSSRDPIYGPALKATWDLLQQLGQDGQVDMGIAALAARWAELEPRLTSTLVHVDPAPVLFPAHLDNFCQTAPTPVPDPDPTRFLHGTGPCIPDVRVVWRRDLLEKHTAQWAEIVRCLPPVSCESLTAPLFRVRHWLLRHFPDLAERDDEGDVEVGRERPSERRDRTGYGRAFVIYRGRSDTSVCTQPHEIRPGDVIVVPAGRGLPISLGHIVDADGRPMLEGEHDDRLDIVEDAYRARGTRLLRLNRHALEPWKTHPTIERLLKLGNDEEFDTAAFAEIVTSGAGADYGATSPVGLPSWFADIVPLASGARRTIREHPGGGWIVRQDRTRVATRRVHDRLDLGWVDEDLFDEEDDRCAVMPADVVDAVTLPDHTRAVERVARRLAGLCVPADLLQVFILAARGHDVGKLDGRVQLMLCGGDERRLARLSVPLAKSRTVDVGARWNGQPRACHEMPANFRHEMLSVQIIEHGGDHQEWRGVDGIMRDLVLHLIASHHGHARPFAPVCVDEDPPGLELSASWSRAGRTAIRLDGDVRRALVPPHSIASGISDRFWRLTRHFGWWGLAYLEAVFRLSDWYASGEDVPVVEKRAPAAEKRR